MSTVTIRETILSKVRTLPSTCCPKVLHFIETLEEENWGDEEWEEWLSLNPLIPVEDDPSITPEHLERLRQREKDMIEGKSKVVPFTDEEWTEFCQEMEHSPDKALAKAESRKCYLAEIQ